MQFSPETPRRDIVIQGKKFTAPLPFTEGHVVNAQEAGALNQLFIENVRNNFAGKIKDADEGKEGATQPTQEDLEAYMAEYEFGARRSGSGVRTPVDPVEKEAFELALKAVKAKIESVGSSVKAMGGLEKVKEKAQQVLESNRDKLIAQAQKIVKARNSTALEELDVGDFSSDQAA